MVFFDLTLQVQIINIIVTVRVREVVVRGARIPYPRFVDAASVA